MKEKEPAKKSKKSSELGRRLVPFFILILLTIIGFFVFLHFSAPDKKSFEIRKKDESKIEIYKLTEEEVDKID
ncbi:MAG: hypothetical protein NY202_00970 [Mollicutes bacterium UO1]